MLKETPTQVFSCEYCKIFKNIYFEEHLPRAASVSALDGVCLNHFYQPFIKATMHLHVI